LELLPEKILFRAELIKEERSSLLACVVVMVPPNDGRCRLPFNDADAGRVFCLFVPKVIVSWKELLCCCSSFRLLLVLPGDNEKLASLLRLLFVLLLLLFVSFVLLWLLEEERFLYVASSVSNLFETLFFDLLLDVLVEPLICGLKLLPPFAK